MCIVPRYNLRANRSFSKATSKATFLWMNKSTDDINQIGPALGVFLTTRGGLRVVEHPIVKT